MDTSQPHGQYQRMTGAAGQQSSTWLDRVDLQQKSKEPRWTPGRLLLLVTAFFAELFDGPSSTGSYWAVYAIRTDGRYILAGARPTLDGAQVARDELLAIAAQHDEAESLALFRQWLAVNP